MSTTTMTTVSNGCGCGGAGCMSCGDESSFIRPRFFAGQLLTEDDLQLLTSYVSGKFRYRNRMLFGSGVVNGLGVFCDPCGGSKVSVDPGYALDCCGNDIVVTCPQTLDINALVRAFRRGALNGVECADPCEDADGNPSVSPRRKYELLIRYCEQATDPVSPFGTDDDCGGSSPCEPSRNREGYSFELRCVTTRPDPQDIAHRLVGCLGDLSSFESALNEALLLQRCADKLWNVVNPNALPSSVPTPLTYTRADHALLATRVAALEPEWETIANNSDPALVEADQVRSLVKSTEKVLEKYTLALLDPLNVVVMAGIITPPNQPPNENPIDITVFHRARNALYDVGHRVNTISDDRTNPRSTFVADGLIDDKIPMMLDRRKLKTVLELAREAAPTPTPSDDAVTDPHSPTNDPHRNPAGVTSLGIWTNTVVIPTTRGFLTARGVAYKRPLQIDLIGGLSRLRAMLLNRLDTRSRLADCELRDLVRSVVLPRTDITGLSGLQIDDVRDYVSATAALTKALVRLIVDCICTAMNPAPPDCSDTAVPLATLEVEDCEVRRICSMRRDFVLSPTAVRHWIIGISGVGNLLEQSCCESGANPCDSDSLSALRTLLPALGGELSAIEQLLEDGTQAHDLISGTQDEGRQISRVFEGIDDLFASCAAGDSVGRVIVGRAPGLVGSDREVSEGILAIVSDPHIYARFQDEIRIGLTRAIDEGDIQVNHLVENAARETSERVARMVARESALATIETKVTQKAAEVVPAIVEAVAAREAARVSAATAIETAEATTRNIADRLVQDALDESLPRIRQEVDGELRTYRQQTTARLAAEFTRLKSELRESTADPQRFERLNIEIAGIDERLRAVSKVGARINELQSNADRTSARLGNIEQSDRNQGDALSTARTETDALRNTVRELAARSDTYVENARSIDKRVSAIGDESDRKAAELVRLKTELANTNNVLDEREQDTETMRETLAELLTSSKSNLTELNVVQGRLASAEAGAVKNAQEVTNLKNALGQSNTLVDELSKSLRERDQLLQKMSSDMGARNEQLDALQIQLQDLLVRLDGSRPAPPPPIAASTETESTAPRRRATRRSTTAKPKTTRKTTKRKTTDKGSKDE